MSDDPAQLYLDLLKGVLTRSIYEDNDEIVGFSDWGRSPWKRRVASTVGQTAARLHVEIVRKHPYNAHARESGLDWPVRAETMVGLHRLNNLEQCVRQVLADNVPGDLVEAGVWRGGSAIFMRALLAAFGDQSRQVWAADSFEGLPPPNPAAYPADAGDVHFQLKELAVGVEQVKSNFARYGLLDDRVHFVVGFFKDTLADAPIESVSVLRLDGDMYESTIQGLEGLYPRLSPGGFCIIDDYHAVPGCERAVHDYRAAHMINETIMSIDQTAVYWRKAS